MILYLDTSTKEARVWLDESYFARDMGRDMGRDLLGFIKECLAETGTTWQDLSGLAFYKGPGSFTGLRIGVSVMNTLADSLEIPIVGESGTREDQGEWRIVAQNRLQAGESDQIIVPFYGAEANITKPRK
ncbi:MAG: tRNA (adenosine(37)-N6)-threonylcarbamoyltransferase complex dimerization subunit type 1 TsaB [Candidatus Sacchiramonaceae bacterium]|nr:tRNA (adenosine(37)-N6)-threonylcarbamoyltransferase complex dimerization subunit type 1 TsaB [Candidatus Saccharimonadaceae bacterium]